MYSRVFAGPVLAGLLPVVAVANAAPAILFDDGRWHGKIETGLNSPDFERCSASTSFVDGTAFKLEIRKDGIWYLQLSNPDWELQHPHRYEMTALVDFYPRLDLTVEARTGTLLEIADLDHNSLLTFIENGHTIDLASDSFNEKYDLEGSAKVIQRLRNCFALETSAGEKAYSGGAKK